MSTTSRGAQHYAPIAVSAVAAEFIADEHAAGAAKPRNGGADESGPEKRNGLTSRHGMRSAY